MGGICQGLAGAWNRFEDAWFRPADSRVYALLRAGFALVVLLNLVDLWFHRETFFSGAGIIDLKAVMGPPADPLRWSVFSLIESESGVSLVFLFVAVAVICLGIGWMPRLMIAIVFVWQVSYTYRGMPMIHGWDILLRIQAFILLFSPLGPPLWKPGRGRGERDRGLVETAPRYGLLLTQIQLAVIYWQTVWLKVADVSWRNGEFISYFMLSIYSRFPSLAWAERATLSAVLSYATLLIEVAVPFLLWNRRTRWFGFLLGIGLHASIAAVSQIWLFSMAILVPYLAFLEGRDLDRCRETLAGWRSPRTSEASHQGLKAKGSPSP